GSTGAGRGGGGRPPPRRAGGRRPPPPPPPPPMPERRALLAAASLGLLIALAASAQDAEPPRIGSIDVQSENVFGPEDTRRGFLYRGANALHVVTRETTVRRWLLFSEGDPYDPALLVESERLLRAA